MRKERCYLRDHGVHAKVRDTDIYTAVLDSHLRAGRSRAKGARSLLTEAREEFYECHLELSRNG